MATPRLNTLSIDLSKLLNDEVANATDNGEEFSANQRLLALNKAEAGFISRVASEQTPDELARNLQELLRTGTTATGFSPRPSPTGSIRTVRIYTDTTLQNDYMLYVPPTKWYSVVTGYNADEVANYGTNTTFHWTEINRQILFTPNAQQLALFVLYVIDHTDLIYNGTNDFLLPARFDTEILKDAFAFLTSILIKE